MRLTRSYDLLFGFLEQRPLERQAADRADPVGSVVTIWLVGRVDQEAGLELCLEGQRVAVPHSPHHQI